MSNQTENNEKPTIATVISTYVRGIFSRANEQQTDPTAPARTDAKGRIHPASIINPIDAAQDELVNEMVRNWEATQEQLRHEKITSFMIIEQFIDTCFNQYNVKKGGKNDGVVLVNFNQTAKVIVSYPKIITFTAELLAAKTLIDELIVEQSEHVNDVTKALLLNAFRLEGNNINVAEILKIRRIEIKHEKWQQAMDIIGKALRPIDGKGYIRVYKRADANSEWRAIALDIAAL